MAATIRTNMQHSSSSSSAASHAGAAGGSHQYHQYQYQYHHSHHHHHHHHQVPGVALSTAAHTASFERKPLVACALDSKMSKMSQLIKTGTVCAPTPEDAVHASAAPQPLLPHQSSSASLALRAGSEHHNGRHHHHHHHQLMPQPAASVAVAGGAQAAADAAKLKFWCPKPSRTAIFNKHAAHRHTPPPQVLSTYGQTLSDDDDDDDEDDDDSYSASSDDDEDDGGYGAAHNYSHDFHDELVGRLASCSTHGDSDDDDIFTNE